VTNTYDRLGRKSSAACNGTTTSFAYDWANDVLSEKYTGGVLNGLTVTNQFDTDLRRTNGTLLNGASTLCRAIYGYDNASRLATVSDGTNSATYSYLANSPLVGQIAFKSNTVARMTTSKQYDFLNRLSAISSTPSNAFTYQYNAANQRTMNRLADGSYWRYGYDALGQVTLGNKYWVDQTPVAGQQFDYAFDTIGNRTQTLAGGDQNGANLRVAGYTNNTLNQITSRGVPAAVDVMGDGLATNGVTVNGLAAYRKNEYFRQQLSVTNTAAVWDSVTVAATGQTSVTGHVYVPQAPENYTYDVDGNLLSDGRWTYAWDGENRLLSMTSFSGAPSGSKLQLAFAYDYMGRRIQRIVYTNNGSYVGQYTNKYAYDGWNCLAILTPSLSLSNSFLWGSDLSRSLQGAGGVGGLLKVTYYGAATTNCFVAYDGNGNVSALINAADGTTLANYEYGPFGEVIRATGPMARLNPFTFQTEFYDWETDKYYCKNRFYDAGPGRFLSRDPISEIGFYIQRTGNQIFRVRNDDGPPVGPSNDDNEDGSDVNLVLIGPGGPNVYCLSWNNPIIYIDPFGLNPWCICIAADNDHPWIIATDLGSGTTTTYGRWKIGYGHPAANSSGVLVNMEKNRTPVAKRCVTVQTYTPTINAGYDARNNNCATYADSEWKRVSGESLPDRDSILFVGYDSPSVLINSINQANAAKPSKGCGCSSGSSGSSGSSSSSSSGSSSSGP
jgi:RHS repeat-associated protein